MTWMIAERLFLLSLLTATSYEGPEGGWKVSFESTMIHTCLKNTSIHNSVEAHTSYQTWA